jgi:hypothetical protein
MEKELRVEVDEVDLGFCLFHVLYIRCTCEFINQLRMHKSGKSNGKINKMYVLGVEHVIIKIFHIL